MANALNYALSKAAIIRPALAALVTFVRDIGYGALSTARLLVMVVGAAVLLAAGVLVGSEDARSLLETRLSATDSVTAAPAVVEGSDARDERGRVADDAQQKHVGQYLARRYRVADGAVRMLVSTAFQIGKEKNLDPLLILSVVAIESSLNPFAESAMGAQGLMQIMTRVHARRFEPHGGETAALDPIANMKVGASILHELISRGGSVERGLQLYVGAGNMPDDGGYGARVLGERSRLQMAATGKVEAALSAAIRAATASAPVPEVRPVALPVNTGRDARLEPAELVPTGSSASEAQLSPPASEHSV